MNTTEPTGVLLTPSTTAVIGTLALIGVTAVATGIVRGLAKIQFRFSIAHQPKNPA